MIRYRYGQYLTPPAPFVHVTVCCPNTSLIVRGLPALIDTGADRTVLPGKVVSELRLVEDGRLLFRGFASQVLELPTILVAVAIQDLTQVLVRAVFGEQEPYILLGRDVLNQHRLLLDGGVFLGTAQATEYLVAEDQMPLAASPD